AATAISSSAELAQQLEEQAVELELQLEESQAMSLELEQTSAELEESASRQRMPRRSRAGSSRASAIRSSCRTRSGAFSSSTLRLPHSFTSQGIRPRTEAR